MAMGWTSSTSLSTGIDGPGSTTPTPLSPTSRPRSRSPPLASSSRNVPPSSPPTMDSVATGKGSQYSAFLRTPTTPIMTHCFVDSPAEAPTSFTAFHSFVSQPSSLSMAITPPYHADGVSSSGAGRADTDAAAHGRKRPSPLALPVENAEMDAPLTSKSSGSSRSSFSNELEQLRRSVHQNLRDRPLGISVEDSDSEFGDLGSSMASSFDEDRGIEAAAAFALARSSPKVVFIDTRPLDEFLASHIPRAVHLSVPSVVCSRLRRQRDGSNREDGATAWASLGPFVSTTAGRAVWDSISLNSHLDVIVIGTERPDEEAPGALASALAQIVPVGSVRVLRGGWPAAVPHAQAEGLLVTGESSARPRGNDAALAPTMLSTGVRSGASTPMAMPPQPPQPPPPELPASAFTGGAPAPSQMVSRTASSSSTSSSSSGGVPSLSPLRRSLPQLSLNVGASPPQQQQRRPPPKLSLHVGQPNAVLGPGPAPAPKKLNTRVHPNKPGNLTLDIGDSNRLTLPSGPQSAMPTRHGMPALPPQVAKSAGLMPPPGEPWQQGHPPSPGLPTGQPYSGSMLSSGVPTPIARQPPIEVSTILPSFLYLGPEISTRTDVDTLLALGIRRVLNVALECDDDEGLGLRTSFERYYRIPMKDSVEESGVGKGIRDACDILDDARLHDAPVYVHCKAGKSRSVTVVLAYLIHANAWTLKTSYAYVAERRHGISPNIGFVAELIQFEETELGNKAKNNDNNEVQAQQPVAPPHPKPGLRYTRESLPPEWAVEAPSVIERGDGPVAEPEHTPESTANRRQKQSAADIEVRKNGQWVHGRRAPVDRTTLQPGRRVSKAGLESMMMRPLEPASQSSDTS